MAKNILKIIIVFILGMAGGIFANQIFWPYFIERPLFYQYDLESNPVYVTEVKETIIQENIALVEAIGRTKETVAAVRSRTQAGKVLEGSGFIATSDGLMVTLAELVPQGSEFTFFVDGRPAAYQVLKRDLEKNLALVKISDSVLTTAGFADLEKMEAGERVFLVGAVFENENSLPSKLVNEGIVRIFDQNFIQTNITETGLLAGSPLFNIKGEFAGISTIDKQGRVTAISVSQIREFIGL